MSERPGPRPGTDRRAAAAGVAVLVVVLTAMVAVLAVVAVGPEATRPPAAASLAPSPSPGSFLYTDVREAPPLQLTDPDDRTFTLASLRGEEVLVFFGYTHCPDVCPVTMGTVGKVLSSAGNGTRAVFVTVDPERDTTTWLKEYVQFLPKGFTALTGSDAEIRAAADAWGVKYARVETGSADAYSMSHTADVYLVDAVGQLRAHFPFKTPAEAITQVVREVAASTPTPGPSTVATSPAPTPTAAATPAAVDLAVRVVSSSVWSGGGSPVILTLSTPIGALDDTAAHPIVQLKGGDGASVGAPVTAVPVKPPAVDTVSYVATMDIPGPGRWRLSVTVATGGRTLRGSADVSVLDPGSTARLGAPAPTVHTTTLADVDGVKRAVTTDPNPDPRLYQQSTTDTLASHKPFVLVVDSVQFRVTQLCGKAVVTARYLADRWSDAAFIHAEPFAYTLVSDWPVLSGDISSPPLDAVSAAWGIGPPPWTALTVPWVFVVDGDGIVRAKYQGLMGSADIDVMLALITGDR